MSRWCQYIAALQAVFFFLEVKAADVSHHKLRGKREYYGKVWWIEVDKHRMESEAEPDADLLYFGHVRNLVASNFKAVVKNSTRDVLVNCYAPWCGHSRKIHPIFEQLAQDLQHVQTLEIARIDCTKNTIPVQYHGYPAILLFPGGHLKRNILRYMDKKTLSDLLQWLHINVWYNFTDIPPVDQVVQSVDADNNADDNNADDL